MTDDEATSAFTSWYKSLATHKVSAGVAKGTIAAAIVVLERLRTLHSLALSDHTAAGGTQIKGASGAAVAKILARFGETRPFAKEGGRTNRGLRADIGRMLQALQVTGFADLSADQRAFALDEMQQFLVGQVREFHNRQRLKPTFDPARSIWQFIQDLLLLARETGKEGPVAQHLVGAKLALRFPAETVGNESYSTADDQLGRPGDFLVGSTAFHVTVAPMAPVYEKCRHNLDQGLRSYLLVPDRSAVGARQNAEMAAPGRITVASIEGFVSQNVEEQSTFHAGQLLKGLYALLSVYNERVEAVEPDRSMMIDIPPNLHAQSS